jgi:hypothetical protein
VGVETRTNVDVSRGGRCRFTEVIGRCRFTEGRTRGGSLPLAALIGSIDNVFCVLKKHETCTDPKLIAELALLLPRCTVQN